MVSTHYYTHWQFVDKVNYIVSLNLTRIFGIFGKLDLMSFVQQHAYIVRMERRNLERVLAKDFSELKRNSVSNDARLFSLMRTSGFALGKQRTTRLKEAGCAKSGTLLHEAVAQAHGDLLVADYRDRINGSAFKQERLRYLTVVSDLIGLDRFEVSYACERLKKDLQSKLRDHWWLGVIEIELVSLDLMRASEAQRKTPKKLLHKWQVCEGIKDDKGGSVQALIHAHIVIDFDEGSDAKIADRVEDLRKKLKTVNSWNREDRQIELKRFSEHWKGKKRDLDENVKFIGHYGTKSRKYHKGGNGNDVLRFNLGFGNKYEEDDEAKTWMKMRNDYNTMLTIDNNGVETKADDRRGLNAKEIGFLDTVVHELMFGLKGKIKDGRGYVIGSDRK